jgi:hypothetical protein
MKPIKMFIKRGGGIRKRGEFDRGVNLIKDVICMYGNITVKQ